MAEEQRLRAENVRLLQYAIGHILNQEERKYFIYALNTFQKKRDRHYFVRTLRNLLRSPEKQEILPYVLAVLPQREREYFLQLWMETSSFNSFYFEDQEQEKYSSVTSLRSTKSLPERRERQTQRLNRSMENLTVPNYPSLQYQRQRKSRALNVYSDVPIKTKSDRPIQASTSMPHIAINAHKSKSKYPLTPTKLNATEYPTKVVKVKRDRARGNNDFGFSIRGGLEHGLGIYVSSVETGSMAERAGLTSGDQILKLNERNFQNIHHSDAVEMIKTSKKLKLLIFSSGVIPGSRLAHMEYQWIDTFGRPTSPPLNLGRKRIQNGNLHKSEMRLLADDDERKVNLLIQGSDILGLRIRGGMEYGLGIYVAGVDKVSAAERAGIRIGDQILDVNGISFLEISHQEAVKIMKKYRMMTLILRDIGKIPFTRTVYDKTEWLNDTFMKTSRSASVSSSYENGSNSVENPIFRQGIAGSQLLHQSAVGVSTHDLTVGQARNILQDNELVSLKYYLKEYQHNGIPVEGLVLALFHLLNSPTKMSLLTEIRSCIYPQDIDKYDKLVLGREIEAIKEMKRVSPDPGRFQNGDYDETPSHPFSPDSTRNQKTSTLKGYVPQMQNKSTNTPGPRDLTTEDLIFEEEELQQESTFDFSMLKDEGDVQDSVFPSDHRNGDQKLSFEKNKTASQESTRSSGVSDDSGVSDLSKLATSRESNINPETEHLFELFPTADLDDSIASEISVKSEPPIHYRDKNKVSNEMTQTRSDIDQNTGNTNKDASVSRYIEETSFREFSTPNQSLNEEDAKLELSLSREYEIQDLVFDFDDEDVPDGDKNLSSDGDLVPTLNLSSSRSDVDEGNAKNDIKIDDNKSGSGIALMRSALLPGSDHDEGKSDASSTDNLENPEIASSPTSTHVIRSKEMIDPQRSIDQETNRQPDNDDFSFNNKPIASDTSPARDQTLFGNERRSPGLSLFVPFGVQNSILRFDTSYDTSNYSKGRYTEHNEPKIISDAVTSNQRSSMDMNTKSLSNSNPEAANNMNEPPHIEQQSRRQNYEVTDLDKQLNSRPNSLYTYSSSQFQYERDEIRPSSNHTLDNSLDQSNPSLENDIASYSNSLDNSHSEPSILDQSSDEFKLRLMQFQKRGSYYYIHGSNESHDTINAVSDADKNDHLETLVNHNLDNTDSANLCCEHANDCSLRMFKERPSMSSPRYAQREELSETDMAALPMISSSPRRPQDQQGTMPDGTTISTSHYSSASCDDHMEGPKFSHNVESKLPNPDPDTEPRSNSPAQSNTSPQSTKTDENEQIISNASNKITMQSVPQPKHTNTNNKTIPLGKTSTTEAEDRKLPTLRHVPVGDRGHSPLDGCQLMPHLKHVDTGERTGTHEDESPVKLSVHKLRQQFEFQKKGQPRTEYLSNIIRKRKDDLWKSSIHVSQPSTPPPIFEAEVQPSNLSSSNEEPDDVSTTSSNDTFDVSSVGSRETSNSFNTEEILPTDSLRFSLTELRSKDIEEDPLVRISTQITKVSVDKHHDELGIVLDGEAYRKEKKIKIKTVMEGESYAACKCPELRGGQEILAVDGESLDGVANSIAFLTLKTAFNNPSGRYLELTVQDN